MWEEEPGKPSLRTSPLSSHGAAVGHSPQPPGPGRHYTLIKPLLSAAHIAVIPPPNTFEKQKPSRYPYCSDYSVRFTIAKINRRDIHGNGNHGIQARFITAPDGYAASIVDRLQQLDRIRTISRDVKWEAHSWCPHSDPVRTVMVPPTGQAPASFHTFGQFSGKSRWMLQRGIFRPWRNSLDNWLFKAFIGHSSHEVWHG